MGNKYIIRPAPKQDFGKFVRRVVALAEGSRVETDTSTRMYSVRVNEATYRRWVESLSGSKPAPVAEPAAKPEPEAKTAAKPELELESKPEPAAAPKRKPGRKTTRTTTQSKAGA